MTKIEQIITIKLPCDIGGTIFDTTRDFLEECIISGIRVDESKEIWVNVVNKRTKSEGEILLSKFGAEWFLEKIDAEKSLLERGL